MQKIAPLLLLCFAASTALAYDGPDLEGHPYEGPATPAAAAPKAETPAQAPAPQAPAEAPAPEAPADAAPPAAPEPDPNSLSSIAAVVNDEVVSSLDLENRLRMVLATTGLEDTPETRERLRPQILRALIDEKLELQAATKENIDIKQDDIDHAVATIEQNRGMAPGELVQKLDALGVPRSTFYDQIRAQLAWTKLVLKTLRPKVKVSDDEIERELGHVQQEAGASEMQIEVLGLPVEHPEDDAQVRRLGEKLAEGVRSGAPFESVARELGGASAANAQSIEPFWVAVDQMDPTLAKALEHEKPGGVVGPVRTLDGYTLAKLVDVRRAKAPPAGADVTEVVYKDILLKLKPTATPQDANLMLSIGKQVAEHPGTCAEKGVAGIGNLKDYDIAVSFKSDTLEGLPDQLKGIIGGLSVGGVSEPFASEDGIRLFMLCERVEKPAQTANREQAAETIYHQKLELEAQKYLRNLKRDATIDVRG